MPDIRRLLITRHDKIGDFVLALPLCKAIKQARPEIKLSVLVSRVNFDFAKQLEFIDDVILYSDDFWSTLRAVREQQFDASISCFIDHRLGALLAIAGIPQRVAPATKLAQLLFNQRVTQRRSQVEKTEWQYNMDLAAVLFPNTPLDFAPPLIELPDVRPQSRVVFHPGFGGSSDGNLRIDDYLRLARRVAARPGVQVVFTFGPDDQHSHAAVKEKLDFPATLIQSTMSLFEFCRFLAESRLFVSTSTGPMHLAGAVNTPTVSFFGNSLFASSRRWATISAPQRQRNFMIGADYSPDQVADIEQQMIELLEGTEALP